MPEPPLVPWGPVVHFLFGVSSPPRPRSSRCTSKAATAADSNVSAGPQTSQKRGRALRKTFSKERPSLFFVFRPGRRVRRTLQTQPAGFQRQPVASLHSTGGFDLPSRTDLHFHDAAAFTDAPHQRKPGNGRKQDANRPRRRFCCGFIL